MRRWCRSPGIAPGTLSAVGLLVLTPPATAQHAHADEHAVAGDAELVAEETSAGVVTLRLGPLSLPARSDHHEVAQAPGRFWEIPFDGWILSYTPRLTDAAGETAPGRLLHHVAFYRMERSDFLCPDKEEHIFGAGGEMNEWMALPGVGYRVARGDHVRVNTMFHNPTPADHPEVYLEVRVAYQPEGAEEEPRRNVYPAWFDVQECGRSAYDLEPGRNVTTGEIEVPVSGRLLGVGGHLHTFGKELVLAEARGATGGHGESRELARLVPETDEKGRIVSIPVVPFLFTTGGHPLEAGEVVRVTARYENPTGRRLPEGAMGIVVGYFLPDDDGEMERFRRKGY